jgi:hypothetical protein
MAIFVHDNGAQPDVGPAHPRRFWPRQAFAQTVMVAGLLFAPWLWLWWPVLSGAVELFERDLSGFALPSKHYWLERVSAGELPAWTPYVSGGVPFLADLSNQAFYPLNLLLFVFEPLPHALSCFMAIHLLIGSIGVFALVRAMRLNPWVGIWAGGLYGFCGYPLSIMENVVYAAAVAWAPMTLAAFTSALTRGSYAMVVPAALGIAMMVLAGDTLIAPLTGYICALMALRQATFRLPASPWSRPLLLVTLTAALCALLAAAQISPTVELLQHSIRSAGVDGGTRQLWSFPIERTLELVQPYLFGTKNPESAFLRPDLYPDRGAPWVASVYVGLVTIALGVFAVAVRAPYSRLYAVALLSILVVSFGSHTPVLGWLTQWVPLANLHRYPEKLLYLVNLSAVVLAALGLHALSATSGRRQRPLSIVAATLGAIIPVAAIWWLTDIVSGPHLSSPSPIWQRLTGVELSHGQGLITHLLALGLIVWLAWLISIRNRLVAALLMATVAFADLAWIHSTLVPTIPGGMRDVRNEPAGLQAIRRHQQPLDASAPRIWVDLESFGGSFRMGQGAVLTRLLQALPAEQRQPLERHFGAFVTLLETERLAPNHGARWGIRYLNGHWSPLRPSHLAAMEQLSRRPELPTLLARQGVEFVITAMSRRLEVFDSPRVQVLAGIPSIDLAILQISGVAPRVRSVERPVPATPGISSFTALLNPTRTGDLTVATVQALPGDTAPRLAPLFAATSEVAIAHRVARAEHHITELQSQKPVFLVNTESWLHGWSATIDDKPAPLLLADGRFMAVAVPPGAHRVDWRYEIPGFKRGLLLTGLGVLLSFWLVLYGPLRRCLSR